MIDRKSRQFSGLDRATEWLNSSRLTASSLARKVVLVDFLTYTCINWLRTLHYLRAWAQKYQHTRDVHLVMGSGRQPMPVRFRVSLDGQPPGAAHGVDADAAGNGTVMEPRLYQLIRQPAPIVAGQFEIEFLDAAVEAFAFTFG